MQLVIAPKAPPAIRLDKPRPIVIDFMATDRHFIDHVRPIYEALPAEMRGAFLAYPEHVRKPWGFPHSDRAGRGDMVLVCSYGDLRYTRSNRRPTIFMEHGAGFTFANRDLGSYAGYYDRPNVCLFLCQNEQVVRANAQTHPYTPAAVVGVPKLDPWHTHPPKRKRGKPTTVAFAFHWDCIVTNATRSALTWYVKALPDLVTLCKARGWELLGHGHPRWGQEIEFLCMELGIEFVKELDDVFARADVMIADATSAMYEFASLDRPVLSLNAPWYRSEPDGGIRFWQHIPGVQCDEPADLCDQLEETVSDPQWAKDARHAAVDFVYPVRGNATETAVTAIHQFIKSCS